MCELDYRETPFARFVWKRHAIQTTGPTGLVILKKIFQEKFERQCLKDATVENLLSELYMKESDHPDSRRIVEDMVEVRWLTSPSPPPLTPPPISQRLNQEFTNLEEFRLFSRRADKLLPETLSAINEFVSRLLLPPSLPPFAHLGQTIPRTKEKFLAMRDNTTRDRMAADVEIKVPLLCPVALL